MGYPKRRGDYQWLPALNTEADILLRDGVRVGEVTREPALPRGTQTQAADALSLKGRLRTLLGRKAVLAAAGEAPGWRCACVGPDEWGWGLSGKTVWKRARERVLAKDLVLATAQELWGDAPGVAAVEGP
jgi:hypothetical protein